MHSVLRTVTLGLVLATAAASTITLSAQASDPAIGTWKLNLTKSKYDPGPAPKSLTLKYDAWDRGIKLTADGVDAEGKPTHSEFAARFDGKDYPWKGNPNADTIALKRIDDYTIESVWKKGGKVTTTSRTVISRDGKTRTITQRGKDAQGRDVNNSLLCER